MTGILAVLNRCGDAALFGLRVFRDMLRAPREGAEIMCQIYEMGWRSLPPCPEPRNAGGGRVITFTW